MGWTHRWVCQRRRVRVNTGRMEELWAACLSLWVWNRALSQRRDRHGRRGTEERSETASWGCNQRPTRLTLV